jgi:hypothetical protein
MLSAILAVRRTSFSSFERPLVGGATPPPRGPAEPRTPPWQFVGTTAPNVAGEMPGAFRKSVFAVPFGCLIAIGTHFVRFGDDHTFGGNANEALVSLALGGSVTIALVILHAFLTVGSTTVTGTIARTRVGALLPKAPTIFTVAAAVYYGIETLEGNGVELGFPTLVLALMATLVAFTLRALCAQLACFVHAIVSELIALLSVRPCAVAQPAPQSHPLRAQTILAARRLGRAPPNERRFF